MPRYLMGYLFPFLVWYATRFNKSFVAVLNVDTYERIFRLTMYRQNIYPLDNVITVHLKTNHVYWLHQGIGYTYIDTLHTGQLRLSKSQMANEESQYFLLEALRASSPLFKGEGDPENGGKPKSSQ